MKYIIFNFLLFQIISQPCESINDCRDYTEEDGVCESVYKICSPIITAMDYYDCAKYFPSVIWDDDDEYCTCEDGFTLSQDKGACFISLLSNSDCGSQGFEKDCEIIQIVNVKMENVFVNQDIKKILKEMVVNMKKLVMKVKYQYHFYQFLFIFYYYSKYNNL